MVQKYSLVFLMMVLQLTKTDWWSTKFHGKCMNFMLHCSINSYIPREVGARRCNFFKPMAPECDEHLISPYNITPELDIRVMRIT